MMASRLPVVDLYWSFRSPYSYLATPRLMEMVAEWEMQIQVQIVLPLAVRTPDFFQKVHPLWAPYLMTDVFRLAEQLNLPFRWPAPDPVAVDRETMVTAADQPHIHRLSRMGVLASEDGRGLEFIREVSGIIFGGIENWDQGEHLAEAADRAGCDLADLDQRAVQEAKRLDGEIEKNQKAQLEAGHWGVPLMVCEGEPFFGQDRIETLLWRLQSRGLKSRV